MPPELIANLPKLLTRELAIALESVVLATMEEVGSVPDLEAQRDLFEYITNSLATAYCAGARDGLLRLGNLMQLE